MFEKLEDRPRDERGRVRNPWFDAAFTALATAMIRVGTARSQQAYEAMWTQWFGSVDPVRSWAASQFEAMKEARLDSMVAGAFDDVSPEDAAKPARGKSWRDL